MIVGEVCNREVVVIDRDESTSTAAQLMRRHHVGDLVIVEERAGRRFPAGVVTDRDLVIEVMAPEAPDDELAVRDLVTEPPQVIGQGQGLFDALASMRAHAIRRLPVVDDDGALVGILTVDDVVGLFAEVLQDLAVVVGRQSVREARRRP